MEADKDTVRGSVAPGVGSGGRLRLSDPRGSRPWRMIGGKNVFRGVKVHFDVRKADQPFPGGQRNKAKYDPGPVPGVIVQRGNRLSAGWKPGPGRPRHGPGRCVSARGVDQANVQDTAKDAVVGIHPRKNAAPGADDEADGDRAELASRQGTCSATNGQRGRYLADSADLFGSRAADKLAVYFDYADELRSLTRGELAHQTVCAGCDGTAEVRFRAGERLKKATLEELGEK